MNLRGVNLLNRGSAMKKKFSIALVMLFLFVFSVVELYAAETRIAVLPFKNLVQKPDWNWLSEGIASTITSKLGNMKGISIVERSQLQAAISELGLQHAGIVDDTTAVKAGKILGVQVVILGEFQVVGDVIRISARFVEVQTAKVVSSSLVTGSLQSIFTLQDDVSLSLAKSLNIDVPEEAKKEIKSAAPQTSSLSAYEYYSKGYDYEWNQKDTDKALEYYQKAISADPNYENALFELGYIYSDRGEYKKSIDYYTRAYNVNPKAKDIPNNIGLAYSKAGEYENAEKWYKKSLEIDPNYTLALNGLGLVYHKKKQYAEAEFWYKKTIQIDPNYHLAYYNLGIIYEDLKKYPESIEFYKKAISINPKYINAMINLGLIYETVKKDYSEAWRLYKKAIDADPNSHLGYYNMGFLYSNKEYENYDIDKAIYNYQQAIIVNPKYDLAYFYIGKLYTQKKEYSKAANAYEKAIQLYDKDPSYYNNLGWVNELQKQYAVAERYYRKALEIDPSYKLAWENLGYALYNQNTPEKDKEAVEAWKKGASLGQTGAKDALKKYFNIDY